MVDFIEEFSSLNTQNIVAWATTLNNDWRQYIDQQLEIAQRKSDLFDSKKGDIMSYYDQNMELFKEVMNSLLREPMVAQQVDVSQFWEEEER